VPDGQGEGQGLCGQVVELGPVGVDGVVTVEVVVDVVGEGLVRTVVGTTVVAGVVQPQVRQPRAGTEPLLGFTTSPLALKYASTWQTGHPWGHTTAGHSVVVVVAMVVVDEGVGDDTVVVVVSLRTGTVVGTGVQRQVRQPTIPTSVVTGTPLAL